MLIPKATKKPTANPFTEDDEEKRSSGEEGIERVQTKDENPHEKEVSIEEPDDEEEAGPSRTERRRERGEKYGEMQKRAEAAEARAREAEQRSAALWAQQQTQPRQTETRPDPLDEEEKAIQKERADHFALADVLGKTKMEQGQVDAWRTKYAEIQDKLHNVAIKKAMRGAGAQQPQNTDEQVMIANLRMRYPDVVANQAALAHADGLARIRMGKMLAENKRPALSLTDYEEIMQQTRRELRMPGAGSPPPTDETRRKFSGQPVGGSASGGRGERTMTMNKAQMKMAEAMYKSEKDAKTGKSRRLSPQEAHAKWARTVGKKVLQAS